MSEEFEQQCEQQAVEQQLADMRRAAMNWLARRDYSRLELARRLRRRFGETSPVEAVLGWLTDKNFLNESRFLESFVRGRIDRGQGPLRIRQELQQRGLTEPRVEQALNDSGCDWFALAADVRKRRFGAAPPANDRKEKARQLRFLQYRGFTTEQCFQALGGDD